MKFLKSKKFLGICLLFLAIPFIINFLSCFQAPYKSWESPSNWTLFWGQYLSGFAAFAMLYVAWRTLLTTKEANRPFIIIDIVDKGYSRVFIRCRNVGKTTATNVKINLDESFIEKINIEKVRQSLHSINNNSSFTLEANGEKVWEIFLIPGVRLDSFHRVFGSDAKYPFRGEYILKTDWENNENIFRTNILYCSVTYDDYSDKFEIDYNNILDGISHYERISSDLFSIMTVLSHINENITKTINGTEQDK